MGVGMGKKRDLSKRKERDQFAARSLQEVADEWERRTGEPINKQAVWDTLNRAKRKIRLYLLEVA